MRFRKRQLLPPAIDITPIVDTVFNLMIFFALSLNFISMPGIQVNLPKARPDQQLAEEEQITITITKDRKFFLQGRQVTLQKLREGLKKKARSGTPNRVVVIKADGRALHAEVVAVMEAARSSGLRRLAIATLPPER